MGDVAVSLGDAKIGQDLIDPICKVYDEVFSAPPFSWRDEESLLHRARLSHLLDVPSFGIATAMLGEGVGGQAVEKSGSGCLVGFAYGFTLPPDTRWWDGLSGDVDVDTAREWPGRTFQLFDFAVLAPFRCRGIGKALHDLLLASRTEERATLATEPSNVETKRTYERWRWRMVGQAAGGPTDSAPLFDCYLRDGLDDLRLAHRSLREAKGDHLLEHGTDLRES